MAGSPAVPGGFTVCQRKMPNSSFPLTPRSGRRGRRFKSGHPDREMAGTRHLVTCRLHYTVPVVRF